MSDLSFQIKGSVLTVIVLELYHYTKTAFEQQLQDKINQAPMFFKGSPVIISLEKLSDADQEPDFPQLFGLCSEYGLQPIAVRGGSETLQSAVRSMNLAILPPASIKTEAKEAVVGSEPSKPVAEATSEPEPAENQQSAPTHRPTRVITQPVRAGQQIYAAGADLIVLSQVAETAEVLADGHIHIYGPLRGRALAGVNGDHEARIFCQSMEAQLISVAGNFMLSDDIRENIWKLPAQAYLTDESLRIQALH